MLRQRRAIPFLDEVELWVEGGRGGDGALHFRREAFVPKGGPDGGDGGRGGDVIIRVNPHLHGLSHLQRGVLRAGSGEPGAPGRCAGKRGDDLYLEVPQGTLVYDAETGELLKDLVEEGEEFVVARGGEGGKGNARFVSPTNRTPRRFTRGKPGERRKIRLELQLFAHAGLVGFPNAGKSSLLRVLTRARPRVGDYPFTTLFPALGVITDEYGESFILADLPGICEGASRGVGLGDQFLKHIQRSGYLVEVLDGSLSKEELVRRHKVLVEEIASFPLRQAGFVGIVLNKGDLLPAGEQKEKKEHLEETFHLPVWVTSTITMDGIAELKDFLLQFFHKQFSSLPRHHALGR